MRGRTAWLTVGAWLIALAVLGSMAGRLTGAEKNDASAWLPGGAESTQVIHIQQRFQDTDTTPTVIVYERRGGITAADRAKVSSDARGLATLVGVAGPVAGPIPSTNGDRQALELIVSAQNKKIIDFADAARDLVKRDLPSGLTVHVAGPGGTAADQFKVFQSLDGFLLLAAGLVVIVLLLLIYRSPFLWVVPVVSVVAALGVSEGLIYLLAAHAGLTVNGQTAGILPVLVFGVGTDYALLLIARYREELHRHPVKADAMRAALRRAGPAVLASAATVAAGLLCLTAAELTSTAGLGPVAAIGVVCGLAAMTTLLPALLVLLPRRVFWPKVPRYDASYTDPGALEREHGVWARIAAQVSRRPRLTWLLTTAILLVLIGGLTSLKASGLSTDAGFVTKPDSTVGNQILDRHFAAGTGAPAQVVAKAAAAAQLKTVIERTPGVTSVGTPLYRNGYVQYGAVLKDSPDSKAAQHTVNRLRANVHPIGDAKVGGLTASTVDINRASSHDNKLIIPIVLVVVFLILMLLLRAVVAPLIMMATVVLSFLAALGVSGFFFTHVFGFAGADVGFPLLAFIFLVALGVDYNIFLMTRVREESATLGTRQGVVRGLTVTGGVITSAGLVLAATFAALTVLPLVSMVEMGFVVAFGVLLDTVIVRSLLLPALAYDLGGRVWWPSALDRGSSAGPPKYAPRQDEQHVT